MWTSIRKTLSSTKRTIKKEGGKAVDSAFAAADKAFEAADQAFKAADQAFESMNESFSEIFSEDNMSTIETDDLNVKVNGRMISINGDVKQVIVNGQVVYNK